MRLAETCWKKYVLECKYSPFTKITYMLTFLPISFEQFRTVSQSYLPVSQAAILILPQVKLNLQLSHFFKWTSG